MTPWLYGLGGSLIAGALLGWTVRDWKSASDTLAAQNAAQERYEKLAAELSERALAYEDLAQQIRASERTNRVEIREVFRNVEVPSNCAVPDAAVSVLNNAVRDANAAATGQPLQSVPSPAATSVAVDRPGPR